MDVMQRGGLWMLSREGSSGHMEVGVLLRCLLLLSRAPVEAH